jgi:cyclophilin family peptidyl-prolyl cis-trans isomerase
VGSTANLTLTAGTSAAAVDLTALINLPGVRPSDTVVQMQTNLGPINLLMQGGSAPISVTNFLSYVSKGAYNNSVIHRTVNSGIFILQGGGYTVASGSIVPVTIPTSAAIQNEYALSNTRGTVAFAKISGNVNSATDQWFINTADNSGTLNNQNGGYAVFATVMGAGMAIADKIVALPEVQVPNASTDVFSATPAYNYNSATGFVYANWVILPKVSVIPVFPDGSGATSVLTYSASSTAPAVATAAITGGKTLTINAVGAGSAAIVVTATDSNNVQVSAVYNVTVSPAFAITQQPTNETLNAGSTAVFAVAANVSAGTTYQWLRGGAAIAGATSSRYVTTASSSTTGAYSCVVTSSTGTALTSSAGTLTLASTTQVGRLTNLSVLTPDVTATQPLTLGFVVGPGTPALPLLLRASGPALAAFNVTGYLPDPTVTLYSSASATTSIGFNQGWSTPNQAAIANAQVSTGAFAFAVGSADSAILTSLAAGNYSIVLKSASGAAGSTLGEAFDASASFTTTNSHLVNLSSRLAVGTGHALTAGFYITGSTSKTVLIRGVGPSLASFGLTGLMADPALTLFSTGTTSTQLAANTGSGNDPQIAAAASAVSAFPLNSSGDAALLVTLAPGGYTAQVNSVSGGSGTALVEVYEVP